LAKTSYSIVHTTCNNYRVVCCPETGITGVDFISDLKYSVGSENPKCFDVGANKGQTIDLFLEIFKQPDIYSFEPSIETYTILENRKFCDNVHIFQYALGAEESRKELINYEASKLSSFLELDQSTKGQFKNIQVHGMEEVRQTTVDHIFDEQNIEELDLLKIDTQGYDLEVLRGSRRSLVERKINNVFIELNFASLYSKQSSPDEIIQFLGSYGFGLVGFYDIRRNDKLISWCNGLFSLNTD
jgi:FkbM family methyltransferase